MIELKLFFALVSYYFVMFATPGPNNAMLTASGIKFGFKKTLPHLVGIPLGHVIQITLVCLGLGSLFSKYPIIQFYLKWICFFYLIYLGWKIIGSFSGNEKERGRPLKLYEAALFQFINPKAWVVALTAATAFFPNEESFLKATAFVAVTAPFVCFPSICVWALFGSSIKSVIKNTKIKKLVEFLLSILLLFTAVIIVIN
ncbi:MAG: Threonine/homoserine/homoserine lactone efflux protein [Pelagibacterales bacterium]|nr:Threonine/homoserine/homoserine lactone efflux protein [Pelagibacterales bacterium]